MEAFPFPFDAGYSTCCNICGNNINNGDLAIYQGLDRAIHRYAHAICVKPKCRYCDGSGISLAITPEGEAALDAIENSPSKVDYQIVGIENQMPEDRK